MKRLATSQLVVDSDHSPLFCSGSTTVVSSSFPPAESGRGSSPEDRPPAQYISIASLGIYLRAQAAPFRESLLPCTSPWSGMSSTPCSESLSPAIETRRHERGRSRL